MEASFSETERKIIEKYTPKPLLKGIINRIYTETWTADVQLVAGNQSVARNVPISSMVPTTISVGDKVALQVFDVTNTNDIIIVAVYGRRLKQNFAKGTASIGTTQTAVAHGLGVTPDIVVFYPTQDFGTNRVYQSQTQDATNIYLTSAGGTTTVAWYAIAF